MKMYAHNKKGYCNKKVMSVTFVYYYLILICTLTL